MMRYPLNDKNDVFADVMVPFASKNAIFDDEETTIKTFIAPAKQIWAIEHIYANFTTQSGLTERQLTIDIFNELNQKVMSIKSGITQSLSSQIQYIFAPNSLYTTSTTNGQAFCPLPPLMLFPNWQLKIWESNQVSNNDQLIVSLQYIDTKEI